MLSLICEKFLDYFPLYNRYGGQKKKDIKTHQFSTDLIFGGMFV